MKKRLGVLARSLVMAAPMTSGLFAQVSGGGGPAGQPPQEPRRALIMDYFDADSKRMEGAAVLGKRIFLDTSLSEPKGVSCASCHDPRHAFADPRALSPGAPPGTVGTRNSPSLMYAALIPPPFNEQNVDDHGKIFKAWEGGLFYDGRARNTFEQVQKPFFEANEMNLRDPAELADRLRRAGYSKELREWMGETAWQDDAALNHFAFRALVEFLKEPMFRPFDARIDDHLAGDPSALSPAEKRGLEVFKVSGKCADCHLLQTEAWPQALLSDYGYDNLGVPSRGPKDPGRGAITGVSEELGQFRAPSLRNVALTAPYMHNGSIATLREVMEFYNRRDKEPERWGATDYPETVNHDDLGDLGLTDGQIDDLVALMDAFTDRTLLRQQEKKAEFPDAAPNARPTSDLRVAFPDPFFHIKSGTPEALFRGE